MLAYNVHLQVTHRVQVCYYNSLPGRAPMKQMSHARITIPDDELPPAKKIRKDSEFCESGSVSIHANDDNHLTPW